MRIMWRAYGLAAILSAGLIVTNGTALANDSPVVHVKAVVQNGGVRLEAKANGPFEYTSYRASESLYVVDLSGVSTADPAGDRVIASDMVKGYRELAYSVKQTPMVRLEILVSQGLDPRLERADSQDLAVVVSRTPNASNDSASPAPALKPAAALKPVAAKSSAGTPTAGARAIQQVALSQAGRNTEVSVVGSGPLQYRSTLLQNPDRLVLDFDSSHLRTSTKHIASNLEPVREVRVAQFTPDVSRVVIDLRQPAQYEIAANGNGVTVTFAAGAAAVKPVPMETPSTLLTAKAHPRKTQTAEPPVLAAIPAPVVSLPITLTQSASALAAPVPEKIAQEQAPSAIQPQVANPAAAVSAPAASQMVSAPAPASISTPAGNPADAQPVPGPGGVRYSGEPISVNLKEVDLRDFFRLVHEISGLNVVVDPNVKGTLTIVLDDVPWDQALDIVLRNNDLDKQLDGNVLRIANKSTVKKEAEETRDLAKAQAEAADVVTTTRVLSYAKAADMAAVLKKFLSSRGDILADDRSNTLIIRDVPGVLPVIDNLLRQLDRKSRQVEIEARVVAANRSFDREFGSLLGASGAAGHNFLGGANGVGQSPINFTPAPPIFVSTGGGSGIPTSAPTTLLTNLAPSVPTSGVQYVFQSTNFALDMVLEALEEKAVGKLLSKPRIITQNNQKATVKQGTKIPVQTIINNTVSVQFVDAVLELDVTPQITAEGTIFMDVTVTNDQIDQSIPRVEGIPAIDTQSAQTRVTVNDGATVVVGGVIVSQQRTDVQLVPVLGSVPILGNLFKHSTVSTTEQELLFFLTPRLLPG